MVRSMTGYGRASKEGDGYTVTAEVRSVNHRYFDCTVRLPRMYAYLEDAVRTRVARDVARGKTEVYLTIEKQEGTGETVSLNRRVAEAYLAALGELREQYGLKGEPDLMGVARLPEVMSIEKTDDDEDALTALTLATLDEALKSYLEMSRREGEHLKADVLSRGDWILGAVERLERRSAAAVAEYREKLLSRMREVLSDVTVDEGRILTEAAIFADKTAVAEETVRLRSHVAQLRELLEKGGAVGRKLDFLIQEFNREANTIGSKANDLEMTREVIDVKAEIEKIREQIQNLE